MYTSMGRGRNGLIEQSVKKPKNPQMKQGRLFSFNHIQNQTKQESMFLSKDFVEALKKMEPQEVADILLK